MQEALQLLSETLPGLLIFLLPWIICKLISRTAAQRMSRMLYADQQNPRGLSGEELARELSRHQRNWHIRIGPAGLWGRCKGSKRGGYLELGSRVASTRGPAARAVAAHEWGHAQQAIRGSLSWRAGLIHARTRKFQILAILLVATLPLIIKQWPHQEHAVLLIILTMLTITAWGQIMQLICEANASTRAMGLLLNHGEKIISFGRAWWILSLAWMTYFPAILSTLMIMAMIAHLSGFIELPDTISGYLEKLKRTGTG